VCCSAIIFRICSSSSFEADVEAATGVAFEECFLETEEDEASFLLVIIPAGVNAGCEVCAMHAVPIASSTSV
jgi:hypothetical protein